MFGMGKKLSSDEVSKRLFQLSTKLNNRIHAALGKSDPYIEIESYLYLYTVSDYWMVMLKLGQNHRDELIAIVEKRILSETSWIDNRFDPEIMGKVMDDRIQNYYKILTESKQRMETEYFKMIVDYQVQLIANILNERTFSFYNPVPRSPRDYSPIITDFMLTSQIKSTLIDHMNDVVQHIQYLQGFGR